MLLTREVEITLSSNKVKHFEDLGYIIPRIKDKYGRFTVHKGTKIIIKVEDLMNGSNALINVKCDCPECTTPITKPIQWYNYIKRRHEDGIYYCHKCAMKLFGGETLRKTRLVKSGSISVTHPELVKYFVDIEDSKRYSAGSKEKVLMKCPECGYIKLKNIGDFVGKGFACPKCGDKISYPEKMMYLVLKELDIEFQIQLSKKTFKWCEEYRYDFYIPSIDGIIETHGRQHYEEAKGNWGSLQSIQENDKIKEELALKNNIKEGNYMIIDCRKSEIEFIKNNIIHSKLNDFFDLSVIDWSKCEKTALPNLVKDICNLWDSGIVDTDKISKIMGLSRVTIVRYLKRGAKLNWCNYNAKEQTKLANEKKSITVICLNTNEIFDSMSKVKVKYNIGKGSISKCCRGEQKSAGKHPITDEKLKWMCYEDYLKL